MSSEIKHVQLTWTDLSNITRCQVVTGATFEKLISEEEAHTFAECILTFPFTADIPTLLRPVSVTLLPVTVPRPLTWCPTGQFAFGNFYDHNGGPSPFCSRSFLVKQTASLYAWDVRMTVGFELEFFLLNLDGSPVDTTLFCETKALRGDAWTILTEVVETLTRDFDVPVWRYHAESGSGQFEISVGPFRQADELQYAAVEAADGVVLAREAIYHIAAKYGKRATFLPKPFFADKLGSGSHIHISLERNSQNLFQESEDGNQFLAGVFQNLPNLMLVFAPTGNSYDRLQPTTWSGAYHCIGTENKEAAIRLIRDIDGTLTRFELKSSDGTSNPYLVLGSLIGAGVQGLLNQMELPEEVNCNAATLPIEEQPPRLPKTLSEAIQTFRNNNFNRDLFGEELHDVIVKLRSTENEFWESTEHSHEEKMKMLLQRY